MKRYRVVLDTNVIVAAMRSQTGASHRLLLTIGHPQWESVITPALMYQYETWCDVEAMCQRSRLRILPIFSTWSIDSHIGRSSGFRGVLCPPIQGTIWFWKQL